MSIWIAISLLVVVAVLVTLWPFIVAGKSSSPLDHAVSFYEARKVELQRQRDGGEISDADLESALAEQGRALLAMGRAEALSSADTGRLARRKVAAILAMIGVPLVSVAIYWKVGAPSLPDMPLASRKVEPRNLDIAAALQKIEAHLAKNPNDGRGFEVVAPVYLRAGRFDDAVMAHRRVVELLGETSSRMADLGESLVAQAKGVVNADAREAFERAVTLDSGMAKAKFYLAIAREQDGDKAGALEEFRRIVAGLPEGPARMRVMDEIERLDPGAKGLAPGGDAGQAIANLPPEERAAAIRGMIDALEARLGQSGGSLAEWQRLVRALIVTGERERAGRALERARKALDGNVEAGPVLDELAKDLAAMPEQGKGG
ncbi:MAG TPA: c-type cytochrome biogenesis protein CcmI [Rhabdaerophilum sp.]|nr:c-type cytochrome biogenesis protein CcmI [Rhabdaerophilum sp.]